MQQNNPYNLNQHRAHPNNVRLYIRAMRGMFPACQFQRRLLKMILQEIACIQAMIEKAHSEPVKIKLNNQYAGHLKHTGNGNFLIAKRAAPPFHFTYHQLENVIINNEFTLVVAWEY